MSTIPRPHANCYWVQPGRLLAGEYPGAALAVNARPKLRRILAAGVTFFLDLTHPDDSLQPYVELLNEEANQDSRPVLYRRLAIPDLDVPPVAQMVQTLDLIDEALAAGHVVYVHCWGGVGRTGTVIGCYLVRHGLSGEAALADIARLWQAMEKRDRHPHSPETAAQMAMVRTWQEG
ncbi:MAG: protein-tyrosine phosphatase family protein [Caldilineaceae bacterium]